MIAILIIAAIALTAVAFAIYRQQRNLTSATADYILQPPRSGGLFDNQEPELALPSQENEAASKQRAMTVERAAKGDLAALAEARASGDPDLYAKVLDALIEQAGARQEDFRALVTHIAQSNELRANVRLAGRVMDEWKASPDRRATAEMMHIAALSDDAKTYQAAVEAVIEYSRSGSLPQLTAEDLIALIESQYWALSSDARSSGAGFALKQRLAGVRRELTTAATTR